MDKILGHSNGAAPISGNVIETIKARVEENNLVRFEEKWEGSDAVGTSPSPFKGLRGIFQKETSENERFLILLNFIGDDVLSGFQKRKEVVTGWTSTRSSESETIGKM